MGTFAYARYSSDQQSATSLDDQLRNCRGWCRRQGLPDPVIYSDAAISGARNDRPGYLRLLAAVRRGDIIVVDDLSRLSRDSIEVAQAIRRLTFEGVRVVGVSDGTDTGRKGHKAEVGLRGIMSELYLADLADKTHRGLTGKALAGQSAGGLPYGYRVTTTGQRAIVPEQAEVVRRIYADYLSGLSPRNIAAALNREGVASPRGRTWAPSAIYGDMRRGIGILANPIYVGRPVWNRSQWVKHPVTGKRVRRERPRAEWVEQDQPELAIVSREQWEAVQRRSRAQSRASGVAGRPPRHLLSGLLRCGECGGPLVVVDRYRYGCAAAKDRGTCSSRIRLPRAAAEDAMLAGVREQLLSEEAFRRYQRAAREALRQRVPDTSRKLAEALRVRENVLTAIRAGIITPSTKAEMERAEAAVAEAQAQAAAPAPEILLPRARERWERIVATLSDRARNLPAARDTLRAMVGEAIVRNENGDLFAEIAGSQSQIALVAGAGYGRYLTGPVRIPLPSGRES